MISEARITKREAQLESRDAMHRRCRRSMESPLHKRCAARCSRLAPRPGVTLIELLITVTIIAVLGAVFVGASQSAMETARSARTKTIVQKLHRLLLERWNSYETRRVDMYPTVEQAIIAEYPSNKRAQAQLLADARLFATRELMKLEMPDRWSDVVLNAVPETGALGVAIGDSEFIPRPGLSQAYLRRYLSLNTDDGEVIRRFQGAECLYMVIMLATADGEARTLFSQQDIGDVDGDGAPEFLDGWGQPIQFVRWPAGFNAGSLMTGDGDADHEPIDHFRRDQFITTTPPRSPLRNYLAQSLFDQTPAYRLMPLIFSIGPDEDTDLVLDTGAVVDLDPYAFVYGPNGDLQLATPLDIDGNGEGWIDNIHNHLLDGR